MVGEIVKMKGKPSDSFIIGKKKYAKGCVSKELTNVRFNNWEEINTNNGIELVYVKINA